MGDSNHSPTNKEKVSLLRLAPGSSQEHSRNLSDTTSSPHVDPSVDSSQSSRPTVLARAKLDGATAKQSNESQKSKKNITDNSVGLMSDSGENIVGPSGNLEDCTPSRQESLPKGPAHEESEQTRNVPFLLAKGPIHEESQYTTRGESDSRPEELRGALQSEPGALAVVPGRRPSDIERVAPEPDGELLLDAMLVGTEDDLEGRLRQENDDLRRQLEEVREGMQNTPVVAVTVAPEDTNGDVDENDGKTTTCRWIQCAVLSACVVAGTIAGIQATRQDLIVPDASPPTPAPTLFPCVEEVSIDAFETKNSTGLQLCQGDCNVDDDCAEGLICYQRSMAYAPVPGCSCWESDMTRNDYCIEPQIEQYLVETNDFPLGLCEGNCWSNFDCQEGFVCYDLDLSEGSDVQLEVPGCKLCPQGNESLSNATTMTNSTTVTATTRSQFCVKREDCVDCDNRFIGSISGGFVCRMQHFLTLLSLCVTLVAFG